MARSPVPYLVLLCLTVQADGLELERNGSLKSLNTGYAAPESDLFDAGTLSHNSVRLEFQAADLSGWTADLALQGQILASTPAGQVLLGDTPQGRVTDLTWDWQDGHGLAGRLAVDRLSIGQNGADWEWRLGRQAIGFGRITLSSPLDIIAPFSPDALDTSVRPGVDALRLTHFHGLAGQVAAVGVFAPHWQDNSYLAALTDNVLTTDLLALAGRRSGRTVAGAGFAGQVLGAALKGEAIWYDGIEEDLHDTAVVAGLETEFQLFGELTLSCQYLFNGAGAEKTADYPAAAASAMVQEGLTHLLGQQYLLFSSSWQVHPLCTLAFLQIHNLADGSGLLRPLMDWSLADNLSLQAYVTSYYGAATLSPLAPQSEFGGQGNAAGLYLQYYF